MTEHRNPNPLAARDFTDYRTRCPALVALQGVGRPTNAHRQFLVENAEQVMAESRQRVRMCAPDMGLTPDERELNLCGSSTCEVRVLRASDGLGRGRRAEGDDGQSGQPAAVEPAQRLYHAVR